MQIEKERILGTASELGLVVDRLKALLDRSEKEIEDGLLPAAQIAMAKKRGVVIRVMPSARQT